VSGHADTIRAVLDWPIARAYQTEHAEALAALDALVAELVRQADRIAWLEGEVAGWRIKNQQLRDALEEACDWLDADLAHAPDTPTSMADRELVASWRAALDGTPSEDA
jgi:hypothetical protein